ncbi:SprB repeat-containing protein, partial [Flavobacterium chungangense]
MKKPTILKIALLFLFFLLSNVGSSQNLKPFVREYNQQLKGDILVIGNNILNRRSVSNNGTVTSPNTAYNGTGFNGDFDMRYINIDNGATSGIFSSSSANLTIPNNQAPADPCYRIAYAALYWSGTLKSPADRSNINKVKIKVPNTANNSYQDITGTIIHDITTSAGGINPDNTQAYACFAEITSLLSPTNPNGTYTVANVIASQGFNGGTGNSAGWSLFIVYEDSSLPSKAISTFNGFTARAQGGGPNNTVISGFTTIPIGPVQARFAFAALEGDRGYRGDYLSINGTTITPTTRPLDNGQNNFFNSTINSLNTSFTDRVPNSTNTLGFDTGVIDINPSSNIIKNNDTSATITLGTNSDIFIYYFTAFSVDIIAPKVILTKGVRDASNNDASNAPVNLGDVLTYELGFKNEGNDNARNYVITDELPINTEFNFPADILTLPTGMTMPTTAAGNQYVQYNATTRVLTFNVPNNLLEINDPLSQIRFKVKVVDDCSKLTNACSNLIKNTAYSNYLGTNNTGTFNDQSYTSVAGCTIVPQSTNFLVGVDACKNRRQELCGANMTISASGGYKSYSWSTSSTGSPVIGTSQTLTITQPGTYYVYNTANPPCVDLQEIITVEPYNQFKTNPIIEYADNKESNGTIIACPDNGKPLPKIFLCGANDSRLLDTKITGATSIVWEMTSCLPPAALSDLCANEGSTCENQWVSAGPNGPTFNANTAGQYRVTISSGICFNRYYFNVYKSNLTINETHKDIICNNKGNITVDKLTGYEYVLANASGNNITGYQDSNVFDIWNPGTFIVKYRLKGVSKTCEYKTNTIEIRQINLDAKVDNPNVQPLCFGEKGSIQVSASDGLSGYYFALYDGGTLLQQVGPLSSRVHEFSNLTPGKYYEVEVTTRDENNNVQCRQRVGKYINGTASDIKLTGLIIEPLTSCSEGKIKISAQDGNWGFSFFVNGSTEPQASSLNGNTDSNAIIILAPTPGNYTVLVRDSKLCTKTITVNVPDNTKPTYTISHTNSNCYDDPSRIDVNLTSGGNGYAIEYSINNGATFQASPTFLNLTPGTYNVVVRYGITYTSEWNGQQTKYCTDPAQQVIITGPSSSVTASAGVAELAGCGPLQGGQPTGLIRFTNVEGGTPPYQYSFNGGASWQTSPEKYVLSTTASYDLRVKDNIGCTYKIPYDIILDPKPEDPVIDSNINPVFNCDGTATATVVVNTPTTAGSTTYTYEYYLKTGSAAPVPNTPLTNNVFTNVPSGNHTVIVKYNINTVSTYSNLLQENFGKGGFTTTPGINPAYCFEDEATTHLDPNYKCNKDEWINDGEYAVASKIRTTFDNSWINDPRDHTNPSDTTSRFLCVNVGGSAGIGGILYSKPIHDVIPNQPVIISLWAENLMRAVHTGHDDPKLTIQLINNLNGVGGAETIVATTDTSNPWRVPKSEKWEFKELSLNPGTYNNLSFVIRSYSNEFHGNDVLIDDIWVRQIPKACGNEKSFPIVIDTNGAFNVPTPGIQDAKCSTSNDGTITINATNFNTTTGFYYSTDNGLNWHTSTTSPVTISGLGAGTYKVIVKHNTTDPAGKCEFRFDSVIKAPQAILIVQVDKTAPTCTTPATITVTTVTGGTGSYQYQLSDGSGIVKPFQSSKTFTNVAQGTYTVLVRDANNCLSPASAPITISTLTSPSATLAATTDWCYTPSNPASLVVTATGGVGPYTYKLDNNTPVTTNTFNNVAPGTHTILVTDSNNCTAPAITNIVIEPQLQLNATLVQDLTCLVDASINTVVTGGYAGPYTYTVSRNSGAATAVTSFPYTATLAGNYVFTVTDSKGCPATSNTIVVSPKTTPALTTNKTDITCNDANNGTITVTASNGATTVYTYAIKLSSAAAYTTQSTNQFTGLAAGTYNIKVIDSKGCESAVSNVTIINPTPVGGTISATDLGCSSTGTVPAVVTVVASGGSGSYQYSFNGTSNFTSSNMYSTSSAGTVNAYIKDSKGCQYGPIQVVINPKSSITGIDVMFDTGLECPAYEAHVKFQAIGGISPIRYQIISGPAGYSSAIVSDGEFKNLKPGDYIFRATDKNGCSFDLNYQIKSFPDIVAGGSVLTPIKCFGETGTIQFTVSGVKDRGYDYVIRNAANTVIQSANNISETTTTINVTAPQPAGVYTITVTDRKTNCPATYSITLTQPSAPVSITSAFGTNVNCNNDNSQITVTATGGTPAYTYAYAINPSAVPTSAYASGSVFTIDTNSGANLAWDIYVKDANGCIAKSKVDIISDNTPTVTASVSNQCTGSGSTFQIVASGTGLAPLSYSIGGATGTFQAGNTFSVSAGTYTVHVKDANGCIAPSAAVTVYPQLTANTAVTRELSCSA